jgi:hypothetical protein
MAFTRNHLLILPVDTPTRAAMAACVRPAARHAWMRDSCLSSCDLRGRAILRAGCLRLTAPHYTTFATSTPPPPIFCKFGKANARSGSYTCNIVMPQLACWQH